MAIYETLDSGPPRSEGPSTFNSSTELPRVICEASFLSLVWSTLLRNAPSGDGHTVLVVPGFMGGDDSTLTLRRFLTRLGYVALPWLQGQNTGNPEQMEGLARRFYRVHHHSHSKISLVGQSLGGVYSREIARDHQQFVRRVITLGSPFAAKENQETSPAVTQMFEKMSGLTLEEMRAMAMDFDHIDPSTPVGVPCSALYSRGDGVVHWKACLEQEAEQTENIEVLGSHTGMAMNAQVLAIIADRLAEPDENWTRFDHARIKLFRSCCFGSRAVKQ